MMEPVEETQLMASLGISAVLSTSKNAKVVYHQAHVQLV